MLKKTSSPKIDQAVAQGVNFEVTVADIAKRNEKRAWIVAVDQFDLGIGFDGGVEVADHAVERHCDRALGQRR